MKKDDGKNLARPPFSRAGQLGLLLLLNDADEHAGRGPVRSGTKHTLFRPGYLSLFSHPCFSPSSLSVSLSRSRPSIAATTGRVAPPASSSSGASPATSIRQGYSLPFPSHPVLRL